MEPVNTKLHDYLASLEKKERVQRRSVAFGLIFTVMLLGVLAFSYLTSGDAKPTFAQKTPPKSTTQPIRVQSAQASINPAEQTPIGADATAGIGSEVAEVSEVGDLSETATPTDEYAEDDTPMLQDFGFRIEGDPIAGVPLTFKIVNFREDVTFVLYYGDGTKDEAAILLNNHTYKSAGTYAVRLKAYGPRTPENLYASYVLTVKEVGQSPGQSPFAHIDGIGLGD